MARIENGVRKLNEEEINKQASSVEFATGDTTTDTDGISDVQGEVWLERVLKDAEERRHFEEVAHINEELLGSGDATVHIPKTTGHLDLDSTGVSEGSARTYTQLDNIDTVDVTITSPDDYYKGGIAIPKEVALTTNVDIISLARSAVAEEAAQDVDIAIRDEAVDEAANNVDQTTSGEITPDAVSEAMRYIEENNYDPEYLIINPAHKHNLRTDSQFTNASEYGDDRVVKRGEIGEYLGVRILTSTNVEDKAVMVGLDQEGRKVGPALVWKEKPNMAMEYNREESEHRIFYDQTFTTAMIHEDSVCTIETA